MTKYIGIHSSVYLSEEEVIDIRKNLHQLTLMLDKPSALEKYAYLSLRNSGILEDLKLRVFRRENAVDIDIKNQAFCVQDVRELVSVLNEMADIMEAEER